MGVVKRVLFLLSLLVVGCASDAASRNDDDGNIGGGGGGGTEDVPLEPGPMRLVTWNCHDFFDATKGNCEGCYGYEEVLSKNAYQDKLNKVARVLSRLDGDIVVLQEVENIGILNALASHIDLKTMGYEYRRLEVGNDGRGINIGFMSRVPFESYKSNKTMEFTREDSAGKVYRFARDAVEVRLKYRGHRIGIIGVHFKSRFNDNDPDRRIAEAQRVRKIADGMKASDPEMYVFIIGDMNGTPDTEAYRAVIYGWDGEGVEYKAAMDTVPEAERYSYVYRGEQLLIDHVVSDPDGSGRLVGGTATILHDIAEDASDHFPLAATYMVP